MSRDRGHGLTDDEPWFGAGLRFRCTGCGKCCTGSSASVSLSPSDLARLAEHLRLSPGRFAQTYTHVVKGRRVLNDRPGGNECIFLRDRACTVYEARPTQCRTYPWWERNLVDADAWHDTAVFCEGIDHPTASFVPVDHILEQAALDAANDDAIEAHRR